MPELTTREEIRAVLAHARTIAVLGAHPDHSRPASYVPAYLYQQGYRIFPVNPGQVGTALWGAPVIAMLSELRTPIDIVDIFRRSGALMGHLDEILAMSPLPKTVWLQLGIRHDAFTTRLTEAGIDVVQSRCTLADHRAMGLPPIGQEQ